MFNHLIPVSARIHMLTSAQGFPEDRVEGTEANIGVHGGALLGKRLEMTRY